MNDIIYQSAAALASSIRRKEISSTELTRACIQRIEKVNPIVNAMVITNFERAEQRAFEADAALAKGENWGPLHGVPFTVKDSLEAEGLPCACGTLGRKNFMPAQDAAQVNRLRGAGGILLGKTNTPELCLAFETDNLVTGKTNNPYDPARSSGGSSGGEAAIIASGGSPLGLGSDAGGSIRFPAHCCGIAGIKPTTGRLSRAGHFIPPGGMIDRLWQAGPMSRFVEDLILAMPILMGEDPVDTTVVPMPLRMADETELKGLRAAWYLDNGVKTPTPEIQSSVKQAIEALSEEGVILEEARPDCFGPEGQIWLDLLGADSGELVEQVLAQCGTQEPHTLIHQLLKDSRQRTRTANQVHALLFQWDAYRQSMAAFMQRYDLIISPACALPAVEHGTTFQEEIFAAFSYTIAYNLTGWPGVVVRCGETKTGLPIGVQIVARPWREDAALRAALAVENALGGWKKPAGLPD